jgi:hypothetical protein
MTGGRPRPGLVRDGEPALGECFEVGGDDVVGLACAPAPVDPVAPRLVVPVAPVAEVAPLGGAVAPPVPPATAVCAHSAHATAATARFGNRYLRELIERSDGSPAGYNGAQRATSR